MSRIKLPLIFKIFDCAMNVASNGIRQSISCITHISEYCNIIDASNIAKSEIDVIKRCLCEMECILLSVRDSVEILKGEILSNEI